MKQKKRIGIWMDHSSANVMNVADGAVETNTVESTFSHEVRHETLAKSESSMHNKEQQHHAAYYKQLADIIVNYEEVLLFGPTNAKTELFNMLRADLAFSKIQIDVQDADKMTSNQQCAYVKKHFSS